MTCTAFYEFIRKQIGKGGKVFRAFCGMISGPWCCAYVTYNFHKTGNKSLFFGGKKVTYCPTAIKWCQAFLAQIPLYLAMPGDIIFFDWNNNKIPDHIGHVKKRKNTSSIYTHEGNTNGGIVAEKERPAKYVLAIFRPHFKPKNVQKKKLEIDGEFDSQSIYNLEIALGIKKPKGILTKSVVKALQKAAGTTPDGAWLVKSSKAIQRMVGAKQDGDFGAASVKQLQSWANSINYPTVKKDPVTRSVAEKPYTGKFPTRNSNRKIINGLAYRLCYPYKTAQKKYKFSTGKPKEAYKKAIDKAYPNHKKWPNKRQRAGACCDVFVGTCLGLVGIKVKKDLKNQLVDMPKMKSLKSNGHHKSKDFKLGDVVQRGRKDKSGHTWIVCELVNGKRYVANSHYKHLHGCYAVMDAKPKSIDPKDWKYYKCYTVQGAIRTYYKKGDYGHDVVYIQKFLKWAGFFKGSCNGDFNGVTEKAVKKFQKHVGLKQSGHVGKDTIKKMKAYKK